MLRLVLKAGVVDMKRLFSSSAVVCSIALLAFSLAGCRDEAASSASADAVNPRNAGPEESFKLIVETFRRGIEDIPIGFIMRQESGQSMMVGKNEVSHELIRPTKEGETYRAVITVSSQSRYSIQRTREEPEPDDENEEQPATTELTGESEDAAGQEIFDSELVGGGSAPRNEPRRTSPGATEQFVDRRADQGERDYDLVYEGGRWKLITELDDETEQAIRDAFKRALDTQLER
jgi:hypothetical protein